MSAINNRVTIPTGVSPLTLASGTTQNENIGWGFVGYTITSTTALTIPAADFGLKQLFGFVGGGVVAPADAHLTDGGLNFVSDNVDGDFGVIGFGPVAGT